jgi:CHAT domain-containing protein/tetratricopeptide (TPR) repeat protein
MLMKLMPEMLRKVFVLLFIPFMFVFIPDTLSETVYTVKQGDSLARIAGELFNDTTLWPALSEHNNIVNPNMLRVGQTLRIPDAAWIEEWKKHSARQSEQRRGLYVGTMDSQGISHDEKARSKPAPPELLQGVFGRDYRQKLDKGERLITLDTKPRTRLFQLTGWVGAGQIELLQGRYLEALARIVDEIRYYPNDQQGLMIKAHLYSRSAWARIQLNDFERALKDLDMAIQLDVATGNHKNLPAHYSLRSRAYMRPGNYEQALLEIDKMEYTARQANSACHIVQSIHQRAYIDFIKGDIENAYLKLEQAESEIQKCRGIGSQAYRLELSGVQLGVYASTGRYDLAMPHLEYLLKVITGFWSSAAQNVGFDSMHAMAYGGLGYLFQMIGQTDEAKKVLQKGLDISVKNGQIRDIAFNLWTLGAIYHSFGDLEAAWDCYRLWNQCMTYMNEVKFEVPLNLGMADLCVRMNEYAKALEYCAQALKLAQSAGIEADLPGIFLVQGMAHKGLKRYREAENAFNRALSQSDYYTVLYQAHLELAQLALIQNRAAPAKNHITKAVEAVEAMRETLPGKDIRQVFLADKMTVFDTALQVAHLQNNGIWGFEMIEKAKARSFLDLMGNRTLIVSDENRQNLLTQEHQKRMNMIGLQQIFDSRSEVVMDYVDKKQRKQKHGTVKDQLKQFHAHLQQADRELASLVSTATVTLNELQHYLDNRSVFLNYYTADEHTYCVVVKKNSAKIIRLDIGQKNIAERIRELRVDIYDCADRSSLRALYDYLIEPVRSEIGQAEHIIISPHKDIHHLPFEMLLDPSGHYVGQKWMTSYAPSASVLVFGLTKNRLVAGDLLALGNPVSPVREFASLENAESEVYAIQTMMGSGKVFVRRDATKTVFNRYAPESGIIHIAAHGLMVPHDPLASAILLSRDRRSDGILTASDVFAMDLGVSLVTLSACDTGLLGDTTALPQSEYELVYDTSPGDELVGLSRAFMFAGAPSIVASLWKVETISTEKIMIEFYSNLANGLSRKEALWKARNKIILDPVFGDNPYYWAPFVLIGDWR